MTRYRVEHRTRYRYGAPVTTGLTIANLLPRATASQTLHHASVTSDPVADHTHTHVDAFGNLTTFLAIERRHEQLEVIATSEVTVEPERWPPEGLLAPPWDAVEGMLASDSTDDGLLARACRLDSPLVACPAELRDYATPSFRAGRPLDEAVRDLSHRIHDDFAFDPDFSDVSTPLSDVLEARRGVCQDFAHLAIACLRSVGLPGRYVSGYLETEPPPGEDRLVGADASHAWCATYAPGFGWLAMDPTNDQVPPDRHVVVAWGRDYADVAPVRGVVFGPATHQELTVAVDVVPC
jgi:transglutaminase-like putative cysteine protease